MFRLTNTDAGDEYRKKIEQFLKVGTELLKAFPDCEDIEFQSVEIDLIKFQKNQSRP